MTSWSGKADGAGRGSGGKGHWKMAMLVMLLVVLLAPGVLAWDEEDHEIFDLQDALRRIDRKGDFYSVLGVSKGADSGEITKAYRRKSLAYHPDKTEDERLRKLSMLLTSMSAILRDAEKRERYDRHLARGFPIWRGTDYYYERYRPGVATAVVFVVVVVSVAQYAVQWVFYFRRVGEAQAEKDGLNRLTYAQIRKKLTRKLPKGAPKGARGEAAAVRKRDFRTATPVQVLQAAGEIAADAFEVAAPSVSQVAAVAIPLYLYRRLSSLVDRTADGREGREGPEGREGREGPQDPQDPQANQDREESPLVAMVRRRRQAAGRSTSEEESD